MFKDTLPYLNNEYNDHGRVYLNEDMPGTTMTGGKVVNNKLWDFIAEASEFTADDSHKNDDQIDCLTMGVSIGLRRDDISTSDTSAIGFAGGAERYDF